MDVYDSGVAIPTAPPVVSIARKAAMSSRAFLFTFFHGGGNVPPQLAIARRLVARGHRVRVLTSSPTPAFLERLAAAGCLVTPYESPAADPSLPPPRGLAFGWTPTVLGMAGLAHRLHK